MGVILFFILMGVLLRITTILLISLHKPVDAPTAPRERFCPPHLWGYIQNEYGETRVKCDRCNLVIGDRSNNDET
jgi:hypothetical protein